MKVPGIFDRFIRSRVEDTPDFHINFMGSRTRHGFEKPLTALEGLPQETARLMMSSGRDAVYSPCGTLPRIPGEDFFEWLDVLEAVDAAGDSFNMVELGAGYGRWLVNAAQAVRRHKAGRIKSMWLCGLEANPERAAWMVQHFLDNDLDPAAHAPLARGVSADGRDVIMDRTGAPPELQYGQQIMTFSMQGELPPEATAVQVVHPDGQVEVFDLIRTLTLPQIIGDRVIDLMDIDVQGLEFEILQPFAGLLRRQVKRLHIGTHSMDLERNLSALLESIGFVPQRRLPLRVVSETEWGPIHCLDGIQSWVNPDFTAERIPAAARAPVPAVFDEFERTAVQETPDFHINFLGSKTRRAFERPLTDHPEVSLPPDLAVGMMSSGRDAFYSPCGTLPRIPGEDFFEFLDVLEAVHAADDSFNMVELGAGYGRWLVNGAQAVRRHKAGRIKSMWLCGLEASPDRAAWMVQHFLDNDLDPAAHAPLACGVSADGRDVGIHRDKKQPEMRYGQPTIAIRPDISLPEGLQEVEVPGDNGVTQTYDLIRTLTIPQIIGDRIIDLMDIDVQGLEYHILAPFGDVLARQVKRLHIGTHSPQIDRDLPTLLEGFGFVCQRRLPLFTVSQTPWGPIHCLDGIQSWINPRLTR